MYTTGNNQNSPKHYQSVANECLLVCIEVQNEEQERATLCIEGRERGIEDRRISLRWPDSFALSITRITLLPWVKF